MEHQILANGKHFQFIMLKKQTGFRLRSPGLCNCYIPYLGTISVALTVNSYIDYIHSKGLAIKGDLPIGIYRHSVEAWTEPELFGMDFQAGAPPDEFTDLGRIGNSRLITGKS